MSPKCTILFGRFKWMCLLLLAVSVECRKKSKNGTYKSEIFLQRFFCHHEIIFQQQITEITWKSKERYKRSTVMICLSTGIPMDLRTGITNWSYSQKFTAFGTSAKLKQDIIHLKYFYHKNHVYIFFYTFEIIRAI